MNHLSLFTGIGGLDLAAEAAGFTTVGQCEWADYPTKVLEKHWPDVPRWRDIRTLTKESFYEKTGLRTVDIISGGFPCQPFSVAGKQKGKEDDRYLWPEMLRVIRELKPRWVVGENVPGVIRIAGWDVATSLEREEFDVVVFDFEAAAVGAPHRRERVFFVGNAKRDGWPAAEISGGFAAVANPESVGLYDGYDSKDKRAANREGNASPNSRMVCGAWPLPNAGVKRCERYSWGQYARELTDFCQSGFERTWSVEPDVGRVAHGISNRVDRIKCLGNAVVPQQAYPIFAAIAQVERRINDATVEL